ncbi:MAG: tetratricopeptide repeat protein [Pirellulaceae bacterium]
MRIVKSVLLLSAVAAGILLSLASAAWAETPAELLEQGIYKEETVGNLDEAIEIYRKIVAEAEKTREVAAQAQFRLAKCLLKQGKDVAAVEAFKTLVKDYPDQKQLVAEAKKHLPDDLKLLPAPWKSGERLTLTMKLPGGQSVGILGLGIDAGKSEGRDVWQAAIRRFLLGGENQGVSRVVFDRETNRPLRTTWSHTLLGTCDAEYTGDKLTVHTKGKPGEEDTTKSFDIVQPVFANDQVFYSLRQLPLKVGYKATIPTRIAFTGGNLVDIGIEVTEKETLKTAVGDFECFRVEMNIGQTFWIADDEQRHVVQFEGGGVIGTLSAIETAEPHVYENERLGLSVTAPAGWFTLKADAEAEADKAVVHLIAPEFAFAMIQVQDKQLLEAAQRESARAWAESRIEKAKMALKDVKPRGEGMQETTLAGVKGVSYNFEYTSYRNTVLVDSAFALGPTKAIEYFRRADAEAEESVREQADAIRKSIRVKKP